MHCGVRIGAQARKRMWVATSASRSNLAPASNTVPRIDAGPLTGHVSDTNATQRGYEAELSLKNKKLLLEAIDFGIVIHTSGIGSTEHACAATPV